jgi:hypothetical protein
MKHSITAVVAVVILVGGAALAAQQAPPAAPAQIAPKVEAPVVKAPASPAGKWNMNLESPQGAMAMALDVKVDAANKVTGTLESPQGPTAIAGEVKDGVLGFTISFDAGGTAMEIYFEGKINAEGKMTGTMSLGDMGTFPFSAERVKGL